MTESVMMNWNNINKCILILVLSGLAHITWIIWYLFCFFHPETHHWMNPDYFEFHLTRMVLCCILSFVLIWPCVLLRDRPWFENYFPYLAVIFFSVSFVYGGYSIGISSPVTIAGFVHILTVGLVLFDRKIVYLILLPICFYLLFAFIANGYELIPYAPVFSQELNESVQYKNMFWITAQLYLYLPIFAATFVLFEILLTQWRNREKQISLISQMDPLTGVYNRRKIAMTLNRMQDNEDDYALVLMDLDHFKNINDNYGHDIGDEVLHRVAKVLKQNTRNHDLVGRFGGEEFIVVMPQHKLEQALLVAERCRKAIENELFKIDKNTSIRVTASFGVATSEYLLDQGSVLKQADQALYFAKKRGRNQVRHYLELQSMQLG